MGRKYIKNKNKKGNNTETNTVPIKPIDGSTINRQKGNPKDGFYAYFYPKLTELENQNKSLHSQLDNLGNIVNTLKNNENRLLNRFGWTLIMANILLGALAVIIVFGYFQFIYPKLQVNINSDGIMTLLDWASVGIVGLLGGLWFSVTQFAIYIKNRDKQNISTDEKNNPKFDKIN